jgi:hypothetical protein
MNALQLQVGAIMGSEPEGAQVEVRCFRHDQQRRRFYAPDDPALARYVATMAGEWNVYLGCAPRRVVCRIRDRKRDGGANALQRVWQLWADIDTADGAMRLDKHFRPEPSLVIATGAPHHLHAYWFLRWPADPAQASWALKRLAYVLGADMRSTDVARILRAAGTLNHKTNPPLPVEPVMVATHRTYHLANVVLGLVDPPEPRPRRAVSRTVVATDSLHSIPAEEYVPALTGLEPNSRGDVVCPLHDDRKPSLHIYPGDRGWYCFGCQRGWTIIDLASALWGIEPRGKGYHDIRRRLHAMFGGRDAA